MAVYALNLIVVSVFSFLAEIFSTIDKNKGNKKYNLFFICIPVVSLSLISGFRYKVGTDFTTYSEIFLYLSDGKINFLEEGGFTLLNKIIKNISGNPQMFFLITSVIINVGITIFIIKNSEYIFLSMYFYITTFSYYLTMNGLRQYIASVILISGYKYLLSGNFKKYLIFVLAAFTFHSTALIMIPIYFLVQKKSDSITNIIIFSITFISMIFYRTFIEILFTFLQNTRFAYYKDIFLEGNGANILRIIVWMLPVLITYLYLGRARKVYGKKIDILLNLCFLGAIFMLLASKQIFFARACMYFDLYYLLLLPKICNMFDERTNKFLKAAIMLGYLFYSSILLLSGEAWIYPYKYSLNLF